MRALCNGVVETMGRVMYDGKVKHPVTAHPKVDPDTGACQHTFALIPSMCISSRDRCTLPAVLLLTRLYTYVHFRDTKCLLRNCVMYVCMSVLLLQVNCSSLGTVSRKHPT